nr:protein-glutamate O-methyltransferase CheR [Evansella caseinilytica]
MSDYVKFIEKIKGKTGIDLALYKEAQMKRRLTSLKDKRGYPTFIDYYEAMVKDHDLYDEFLQRMTINVSEFFRNPNRWQVLENKILPQLLAADRKVKFWSAACSTGEEPYSLVMMLRKKIPYSKMDILATDLDEVILERAKAGVYPERSLKDVPKEMKDHYFRQDELGFRIIDEVKKPIRFKQHNLLANPFESGFDMIICRNVMIYFTEDAKDKLYHKFSNALKPGGFLFVGSTEQIFNPQQYGFTTEDTFFYRKE